MSQIKSGYIDLEDGRMYYEAAGEGDPLVLLHSVFDSRMWDDQWNELSRHYAVVRYDMRGFGKSDGLEEPVSRRQELYRLLEEAGIQRAILVGCSLGGETIIDVALERPELVAALIIVSGVPAGFEMQGEPPKELMELFAAVEQGDLDLASELQLRIWIDGPFRRPDQVDANVRRRAAQMCRDALAKGNWGLTQAPPPDPLNPPAAMRLDQIQVPTLIIAGELDNPEILRASEVMAGTIPGAHMVILRDCAHLPNMEKPAEFNQAVSDFLLAGGNKMNIQDWPQNRAAWPRQNYTLQRKE